MFLNLLYNVISIYYALAKNYRHQKIKTKIIVKNVNSVFEKMIKMATQFIRYRVIYNYCR